MPVNQVKEPRDPPVTRPGKTTPVMVELTPPPPPKSLPPVFDTPEKVVSAPTTRKVARDPKQPGQIENGAHTSNLVQYMHCMLTNPDGQPSEAMRCMTGISKGRFEGASDSYGNLKYLGTTWQWKVLAGVGQAENSAQQTADAQYKAAQDAANAKANAQAHGVKTVNK